MTDSGKAAPERFTAGLLLLGCLLCSAVRADETDATSESSIPTSEELERRGAVIGEVKILNGNVFATELPEENYAIFRGANRLHIKTRADVIQRQLLFRSGEPYVHRFVQESARILRSNSYLYHAEIVPVRYADGIVDLEVRTSDVWSLVPSLEFSRRGGENTIGFEIEEGNFLGRGKEITLGRKSDVDRTRTELSYRDPQLFGTWQQLLAVYANNSDGQLREFSWNRPFYSLDARWSAGTAALDSDRIDQRYDLGQVLDEFRHHQEKFGLSGGWSNGLRNGWVRRWNVGAAYERERFDPTYSNISARNVPPDRTLAYPYVSFSLLQDRFEERRNLAQIERTEDLYSGTSAQILLGYASESLGADRNAWIWRLSGLTTFEWIGRTHTLLLSSDASGRIEDDGPRNVIASADAAYYWQISSRQVFYAALHGAATSHLDEERQLLLGGDNGLRGYPLRYQDGSSQALLTLEQRIYTKYYLFRLFHLGGAVFFDVGRTWGRGNAPIVGNINGFTGNPDQGLLKDVGFGLRVGSSRSSFGNVIHIDLAFPLDGDPQFVNRMQFVIETKRSF